MVDVQFNEDPVYTSYLDIQRQIFYKPSTSPVVNSLIDKKIFATEKQAGVTLIVLMLIGFIAIGYLFYKYVLVTPTIDTSAHYVPAITIPSTQ